MCGGEVQVWRGMLSARDGWLHLGLKRWCERQRASCAEPAAAALAGELAAGAAACAVYSNGGLTLPHNLCSWPAAAMGVGGAAGLQTVSGCVDMQTLASSRQARASWSQAKQLYCAGCTATALPS